MRRLLIPLVLALVALSAACGGSSSGSSSGPVKIVMWHGFEDVEAKAMKSEVAKFNATHKDIHVDLQYAGNTDYALRKVLVAIRAGSYPDIAYLYGSWAANIANSPKTVDLSPLIKDDPSINWNDFWPAERHAVQVGPKIIGVPSLVDNLALVYNKKLFDQAHVPYPTANWTWADFRAAAKKLTNPSTKQFGWAYIADGGEDTVWRFDALLWQGGGDILNSDNTKAEFNSEAGIQAATLLQQMAVQDKSVYLDNGNGNYANLFNSGKIAMLFTGPWDLSSFPDVNYGIQILPANQTHATISGPDQWVMFDNGDARKQAAWTFLKWFTSAPEHMQFAIKTGDLPIRASEVKLPDYATYTKQYPGIQTFVENEANATKARPVISNYNEVSEAMGQAIQAVLLGKADPKQALDDAAQQVDTILASGQ
jgi:multiple sugar transport system substrate-binding protein